MIKSAKAKARPVAEAHYKLMADHRQISEHIRFYRQTLAEQDLNSVDRAVIAAQVIDQIEQVLKGAVT